MQYNKILGITTAFFINACSHNNNDSLNMKNSETEMYGKAEKEKQYADSLMKKKLKLSTL